MIDFYLHDSNQNGLADHIGNAYVLPLNLSEDNCTINTVITGNNHKPIGQFVADYLIVRPLQGYSTTLFGFNSWEDIKPGIEGK